MKRRFSRWSTRMQMGACMCASSFRCGSHGWRLSYEVSSSVNDATEVRPQEGASNLWIAVAVEDIGTELDPIARLATEQPVDGQAKAFSRCVEAGRFDAGARHGGNGGFV